MVLGVSSELSETIFDVNEQNFQAAVLEESSKRLVVIDFWADWCAPCKALMPVLEKLATEYAGQFVLAKVNADEQQNISGQFGIRSLPTVIFMKDGQPIDAFQGAQSEKEIRELLDKHLPKPWDAQLAQAQQMLADKDYTAALETLRPAYKDSDQRYDIAMSLAFTLVEMNRCDEAQTTMDAIALVDRDGHFDRLLASLELKREAAKSPEIKALEEQLNSDPDNLELAYQLSLQYSQNNQFKEALDLLLRVVSEDKAFREGTAKKAFLDVLASMGKGEPLAVEYQRKFFNVLY
ncbi:thioredoxin [Gammaproteobacteria bacterium 53_120_T64]|nr:thioredoxin [Gammaproteobacteria bacterium 53_120_T64]